MAWATISDVLSYTKITVDQGDVDSAQAAVELFSDVTETSSDAGLISPKNLRLLKMAVAYQAAWATNQPDLYTRSDVGLLSQDGVSFTSPHANSAILAPMARRAIDRLSWRRNRSQRIRPMQPKNFNSGDMSGLGDYTISDSWSDPTNDDASLEDDIPGWGSM